jgi:hypothetical protein
MSLTAATRSEPQTSSAGPARTAAIAALLFAVALFLTVAVVNVPHDATDTELLTWWQKQGNRTSGVVSGLFALLTAALLPVALNYVHHSDAARRSPRWRAFARSMAGAFTAAMLVTAATRSAVGHLVDVMDEPLPGPDVLRYATALNYQVLGLSAMGALALAILSTSVLAVRTGAYAAWAARVGLGCGALMLGAVLAGFGAFTVPVATLWAVCLAIAIRPGAAPSTG